jgi:hypothetical protein
VQENKIKEEIGQENKYKKNKKIKLGYKNYFIKYKNYFIKPIRLLTPIFESYIIFRLFIFHFVMIVYD